MFTLFFAFMISAIMGKVILITNEIHAKLSHDHDISSVQKHHQIPVPRIGGLAIFTAVVVTALLCANMGVTWVKYISGVTVALFFIFIAGISEDLTKNVGPIKRLLLMSFGGVIAVYAVSVLPIITHIGISLVDHDLPQYSFFCMIITILLVSGVTNSFNIIDGYNGLSATTGICILVAIVVLANKADCNEVYYAGLCLIGSILGFLIYNYPRAKVFLGDCGAYTIGFSIAVLAIYLSQYAAKQICPLTFLLIASYPIIEVLFSIYRRKFIKNVSALHPDKLHMHQLIYYRCSIQGAKFRNDMVMPRMLWFILPQIVYALFFYDDIIFISIGLVLSVVFYIYIYNRITRFKTPFILINFKRRNQSKDDTKR